MSDLAIASPLPDRKYALFAWERVTRSVRAGRRYPADRKSGGEYITSAPIATEHRIDGVTLQTLNRDNEWVGLWDTTLLSTLQPGDHLRLTITGPRPPAPKVIWFERPL